MARFPFVYDYAGLSSSLGLHLGKASNGYFALLRDMSESLPEVDWVKIHTTRMIVALPVGYLAVEKRSNS
jgi:hypothetical protein